MIHLIKLAVGVRDVAQLIDIHQQNAAQNPPLRHRTRNRPKRREEICAGGSLYWVIGGAVLVRQPVLDIIDDHWDDGTRCAGILLAPAHVRVAARSVKAFQGWRYLKPQDAPADLGAAGLRESENMPDEMRRALAALALL